MRDLYLLQLDRYSIDLFVLSAAGVNSQATYELCRELSAAAEPLEISESTTMLRETLRRMIHGISGLKVHPCLKGRFFDSLLRKLEQLSRGRSNEVTSVDFIRLAASVLNAEGVP
jgi:hypothetical protein